MPAFSLFIVYFGVPISSCPSFCLRGHPLYPKHGNRNLLLTSEVEDSQGGMKKVHTFPRPYEQQGEIRKITRGQGGVYKGFLFNQIPPRVCRFCIVFF